MPLAPGTKLGPYDVLAPLGAGGMGEVYRAKDTRLDREVAIKVLPEQFAADPTALTRFEREAKAIAALSHPSILAIYDVGTEKGSSFVVTELLEGETLRDRLRRDGLSWRKAVEIGAAIADGLAAAQAKGIVHRDLKPGNIFLTFDGVVKTLDFGLARTVGRTSREEHAETLTLTAATKPVLQFTQKRIRRQRPALMGCQPKLGDLVRLGGLAKRLPPVVAHHANATMTTMVGGAHQEL